MRPSVLSCTLVALFCWSAALAEEQSLVLLVDKPIAAATMSGAGLQFLADLGPKYVIEGDRQAAERLARAGATFSEVMTLLPGQEVFLVKPRTFRDEVLYAGTLSEVGPGTYLTRLASSDLDALKLLPFSKARLMPAAFPEGPGSELELEPEAVVPEPAIQSMVAEVSSDSISKFISQLSGHEPVVIGGSLDTLLTRYSYNWRFGEAAQFVYEKLQSYGLDVAYETFVISVFDFCSTCFCDTQNGWAVGTTARIFRTSDGGATWTRQNISAPSITFYGTSFVDTLTGWVVGDAGAIYKTTDGGATWSPQSSGTASSLREIFMLDSQNGWTVGYGGVIRRTANGGADWTGATSGVSGDLYGCHFRSDSRGWAVGAGGVVRFWDGTSWSGQSSGTNEDLFDVSFVNDNVGWAVGSGWIVLKTLDGGQHWMQQPVPASAGPYFKSVCFADSLEGWVVGLRGTVLHTTDSGATWQVQPTGTLFGLRRVRFVGREGWAVGYGGTILHTSDGGASWQNQRGNLPAESIRPLRNVVATKAGTGFADEVVICGHVDDTSQDYNNLAPGADDNASGTSAVVEAARVMASSSFKKTIKFIGWSGEEEGLYGSGEYAAEARARGDAIDAVLNFDMIGYVDAAPEDIDVVGNGPSTWLVDFTIACAQAYVPELLTLRIVDPTESSSDHYMFWQAGYDAILSIEDENLAYPYYHTVNDTIGNITMPFCTNVIKMGVAALAELAEPDTGGSVPNTPAAVSAVSICPNPLVTDVRIVFSLGRGGMVKAGIYNIAGRMVRTLYEGALGAGRQEVTWGGEDASGRRASPGIYFARVSTSGGQASAKLIVLR